MTNINVDTACINIFKTFLKQQQHQQNMLLANFQLIRENQISEILGRNKENYFQICKVVIFLYFGYQ